MLTRYAGPRKAKKRRSRGADPRPDGIAIDPCTSSSERRPEEIPPPRFMTTLALATDSGIESPAEATLQHPRRHPIRADARMLDRFCLQTFYISHFGFNQELF